MIVRPDQARIYSMGRGEARILVDAERSGGTWWLGEFREDPGYTTGLHLHPRTDEQFFVLDGVLSVAVVPHGTPHAQANAGKQPVRFLGSGSPCGFERFFPELHELVARLSPSDPQFGAEVTKIVSRHDTQILGPPPPRTDPA